MRFFVWSILIDDRYPDGLKKLLENLLGGGQTMVLYLLNRLMDRGAVYDVIQCLTTAMESKHTYASGHSSRVADMTFDIAKYLGIRGNQLEDIHLAANLHDIGLLSISENILNKKEKLLPEEWKEIRKHPEMGFNILSKSRGMKEIAQIVLYHHERWDGSGYPKGLKGNEIPLGSRIIAVADSMDAMTSSRPFRKAMTWEKAIDEIVNNKGIQFDPRIVPVVEKLWMRWREHLLAK